MKTRFFRWNCSSVTLVDWVHLVFIQLLKDFRIHGLDWIPMFNFMLKSQLVIEKSMIIVQCPVLMIGGSWCNDWCYIQMILTKFFWLNRKFSITNLLEDSKSESLEKIEFEYRQNCNSDFSADHKAYFACSELWEFQFEEPSTDRKLSNKTLMEEVNRIFEGIYETG